MKIESRAHNENAATKLTQEISMFQVINPIQSPVCGSHCSHYTGAACQNNCKRAPEMLTTDPKFPVEDLVAPLVFEIKKTGVFHPCWSCEGHNNPSGELWKVPRVWFYADSVVHIRLLNMAIRRMRNQGLLKNEWHIVVTYSDESNMDTAFSLEPNLEGSNTTLLSLQGDLRTMADNLQQMIVPEARALKNGGGRGAGSI